MDLELRDRVTVIAGSSRGIGKAIAHRFLQEGARVLISGRDPQTLQRTLEEFRAQFAADRVASYCGDLCQMEDIRAYLNTAIERWAAIDIAVANIGSGRGKPFEASNRAEWTRMFEVNLFGGMDFVHEVLPIMKAKGSGSICLIASIAGVEALEAPLTYTAAKAGVVAAGKSLARLMAEFKIRVNVVCPGNILFPGGDWDHKLKANPAEVEAYIKKEVPLKRFGTPEEIADCVAFLCSFRASFVTGACWVLDGGQTRVF